MSKKVIYTNMCMVYNGEEILVLNRLKSDWPGLTFPGGHIEIGESHEQSVIREMKEETGLNIKDPVFVGEIVWNNEKEGIKEISLLYKTNKYDGEIISSKEGQVFFINIKDIKKYKLSTDFDKILEIYFK